MSKILNCLRLKSSIWSIIEFVIFFSKDTFMVVQMDSYFSTSLRYKMTTSHHGKRPHLENNSGEITDRITSD